MSSYSNKIIKIFKKYPSKMTDKIQKIILKIQTQLYSLWS